MSGNHNWVPMTLEQTEAKVDEIKELLFQTENIAAWKLTAAVQHLNQAIHILKGQDRRRHVSGS